MKNLFSVFIGSTFLLLFLSVFAFAQTQVTTYEQNFDGDVDTSFWAYNWAGGLISADRDGTTFKYVTDSLNNYYLGVLLNFKDTKSKVLDLSDNPYVSFLAKAEAGAIINDVVVDSIPMGMDLLDPAGVNIGYAYLNAKIPADGEWHECNYDFSDIATAAGIDSVSKIRFNPGKDRFDGFVFYKGTVWIDDFRIGEAAVPTEPPTVLTTYTEEFSDPVNTELWRPNTGTNDDGTPIFTLTQVDSTLKYDMVQKNFWDGQFYNFYKYNNIVFDLTTNPYFTVDIKVDTGATYNGEAVDDVLFLASPWGQTNDTGAVVRQVNSPSYSVPDDGEWHTYTFDFGAAIGEPMWDGTIPPGDLAKVQAILFETAKWPSNYKATFQIDNFKLGEAAIPVVDPGAPNQFTQISPLTDLFYATWTVKPTHQPMDGVTGLSKGEVNGFSDMGILVRFKDDHIDAYNGSGYGADSTITFEAGKEYTIRVYGDVKAQTYSVDITPAGLLNPIRIATDYTFRTANPQDTLNYLAMNINELELWGGVPGSRLNPSFMEGTYELNYVENTPIEPQAEEFKAKFDLVPTVQKLNSAVTLLKGNAIMDGWGALSAIIRLNGSDEFDVRNGTSYTSDETLKYIAGKKYNVCMDVNVTAQTYSVTITPEGDTATVIATDYAFRAAADTINTFSQLTIIGGLWGGAAGDVVVSNFSIMKKTDPTQNMKIPAITDKFYATWTVKPTHKPMDGVTGLAKGMVGGFGDMGILVRFKDDHIDAYNASGYEADTVLTFEANKEYTIRVYGDVKAKTYSVDITPEGETIPVRIGTDFVFRSSNPQDTLNYMAMNINELELWGGVPGSRLNPSFMNEVYELNKVENTSIDPQAGTFTASFNLIPTGQRLNSAVTLMKGEAIMDGWGALSAIIRLNGDNKFDVRNGSSYSADADLAYVSGTKYSVVMDVDVYAQKYSVAITPEGGSEVVVATDYAFRASADTLNNLAQLTIIGGMWGGQIGSVEISDLSITPTDVNGEEGLPVTFELAQNYPNPFNPSTTIRYALPKAAHVSITIYNALGQVVTEIVNKEMKAGRYQATFNASHLASGLYFYSITAGDFRATKKMMLLK